MSGSAKQDHVDLSIAEQTAKLDALVAEQKALIAAAKSDVLSRGEDFIEFVLATQTPVRTESTGRFGISVSAMPYTGKVNGRAYTVSLHVTDVVETEKGRAIVSAKKAEEKKAAEVEAEAKKLQAKAASDPQLQEALKKLGL